MGKCESLMVASILCVLLTAPLPGNSQADPPDDGTAGVTISLLERKLTDTMLQLRYQIRNESDTDIWICESMDIWNPWDVEVYVGQDNRTLFVQRRLDASMGNLSRNQPIGCYARVPHGQTRTEVFSVSLPVRHQRVFFGYRGRQPPKRATRVVVEIGYYTGNLPARVFQLLEEAERNAPERRVSLPVYETGLRGMMGGTLYFDESNRSLRARDEQVIIPWTDRALPGEKIARMTVEDLPVPYSTAYAERTSIHVTPCKRIEVRFRGSPLGFYFPYPQEQSLLSVEEKRAVESLKGFDVKDPWDIRYIAYGVTDTVEGVFHTDHGAADLTCYRKDGSVLSFSVYDNAYVVTQEGQVFRCREGVTRLRALSPQIKALDLRMECAANLKDLWHCLRLYHIARHTPRDLKEYWTRYREHGYTIPPDALRAG